MKHALLSAVLATVLAMPAVAEDYMIMAPAAPGGGWDGTARAMQEVMQAEGIAPSVEVQNVPGAGGTVGLAQFVADSAGDASQLIVGGYVMVGAILTNESPGDAEADVTPIARLTGEPVAIVVPASSPTSRRINELVEKMKADPGRFHGPAARRVGLTTSPWVFWPRRRASTRPRSTMSPSRGGGEALAAILGNQVTVGISGVGEFLPSRSRPGTMRMLAVSTRRKVAGHRRADD
jgi:putative tricarboxylic transport membrane protein